MVYNEMVDVVIEANFLFSKDEWRNIFQILQFRTSTQCKYTHVEENSCMGIMESLVSTNAATDVGAEV